MADLEEARTLDWAQMKTLHLVIEVLSPSTTRYDRFTKRRLYQERQIPLYWIVDPDQQRVEVWRPDLELPEVEAKRIVWHPTGAGTPLVADLPDLFKPL